MAEMTTGPLVSCVLPTRDRPDFLALAVRYFLRQTYAPRELVIVDTGGDKCAVWPDPRIRTIRSSDELTVGSARNLGCDAARGDLIANWDDDDWVGSHRLQAEIVALASSRADACGLGTLLAYSPLAGQAWQYRPLLDDPPFAAGGSLLFRRAAWTTRPFVDTNVGEDAAFVASFERGQLVVLDDGGWYVALLHPGNTAKKNVRDQRWSLATVDEVAERLRSDLDFYLPLASAAHP